VPEVIEHGHTGFIVEGLRDAVEAIRRVPQLSRRRSREVFEKRFTATRMAHDYVALFEDLIEKGEDDISEAA
jgi:glycosyltransferase involved in cell wall biosynthesis